MAQSHQFATTLVSSRYAHTFLFMCPECNLPVSISCVRPEKNLETIESQSFRLKCDYCNESSTVPAVMAKAHWITEWSSFSNIPQTKEEI